MRLRTENIHEYRLKCNTVAQITLDDDFNVPDTKDDIELIVKEWGNVQTDSVKVNKDKAAVDGEFTSLYRCIIRLRKNATGQNDRENEFF